MAGHSALPPGFARFLAGPLVGRPLLMSSLASLAGNLALLRAVHRSESAILFSHTDLLPQSHPHWPPPRTPAQHRPHLRRRIRRAGPSFSRSGRGGCNGGATAQEDNALSLINKGT